MVLGLHGGTSACHAWHALVPPYLIKTNSALLGLRYGGLLILGVCLG